MTRKLNKEEIEVVNKFKDMVRMKRGLYTSYYQNFLDNIIIDLLAQLSEKKIKLIIKGFKKSGYIKND